MGLNANLVRLLGSQNIKKPIQQQCPKKDDEPNGTTPERPAAEDSERTDNLVNTYTYFSIYEGITSCLGNFYSDTLAKMIGPEMMNKKLLNQLYNSKLNEAVRNALESAKAGNTLDFTALAETVKNEITTVLEACNYDPALYPMYLGGENIQNNRDRFNQ